MVTSAQYLCYVHASINGYFMGLLGRDTVFIEGIIYCFCDTSSCGMIYKELDTVCLLDVGK